LSGNGVDYGWWHPLRNPDSVRLVGSAGPRGWRIRSIAGMD